MKKLVAVLMVMIMLAGMIPFAAFAEGTSDIPKEETPAVEVKNQTGYGELVAEELSDLPENGEDKEKNENNLNDKNPEEPDGNTPATDETPVEGTKEGNGEGSVPEGNTTEENKDPEGTEATEGSDNKDTEEKPEDNLEPKEENKTEEEPKEPVPTWDVNVGYMVNGNWVDWQIIKVPQNTGLIPRPQGNLPLSGYKIIGWYFADTHAPVVFNDTDGASVITETTFKSIYALLEEDIVTYTVTLSYNKSDLMDEIIYNVPTGYVFVDDERLKTYENGTVEETAEDGTVTVYKFTGWDYNGAQILSDMTLHAIWEVVETIAPEAEPEPEETVEISQETETTEEPEVTEETDLTEKIELSEETEGEAAETEIETTEESSEVTGEEMSEEEKISYSIKEEETDKEWVIGSGESFSLASEADLDKFVALYIDGKLVSIENLILTEGSTIVTPDEEILNALGEGEHTFEIVSADGSAKGKFTVMSLGALPDASPEDITVTFNLNGHGEKPIDPVKPDDEGKIRKPDDPKEAGWKFDGWYTNQECTEEKIFSFDSKITESIELFAKWKELFTVTYDMNGHGEENPVPAKEVEKGKTATEPEPKPTPKGVEFIGWYTDEGIVFDFNTETIEEDITLHAEYEEKANVKVQVNYKAPEGTNLKDYEIEVQYNESSIDDPLNGKIYIPGKDKNGNDCFWVIKGWEDENGSSLTLKDGKLTYSKLFTEETTSIHAEWAEKPYYKVTISYGRLNGKNGYKSETKYVVDGDIVTIPNDPSKTETPIFVEGGFVVDPTSELGVSLEESTWYKLKYWEVKEGGEGQLLPEAQYKINKNTTIIAQWKKLIEITYKVSPIKYSGIVTSSLSGGINKNNGKPLNESRVLLHGDKFYIYEEENFEIYSGVGYGQYAGIYIKSTTYGDPIGVGSFECTDKRTGGSSKSYIVNVDRMSAAPTGDVFNPGLWLSLAFVSLAGALMTFRKRTGKKAK